MYCGLCGVYINNDITYTYQGIICCVICYELIDDFNYY